MKTIPWSFRLYVSGVPDDLEEWPDQLYEAGCDDSTCGTSASIAHADFDRESNTLSEAVQSAVRQVESCGYTVDRIEIPTAAVAAWGG